MVHTRLERVTHHFSLCELAAPCANHQLPAMHSIERPHANAHCLNPARTTTHRPSHTAPVSCALRRPFASSSLVSCAEHPEYQPKYGDEYHGEYDHPKYGSGEYEHHGEKDYDYEHKSHGKKYEEDR